jgi:hypothetical protein
MYVSTVAGDSALTGSNIESGPSDSRGLAHFSFIVGESSRLFGILLSALSHIRKGWRSTVFALPSYVTAAALTHKARPLRLAYQRWDLPSLAAGVSISTRCHGHGFLHKKNREIKNHTSTPTQCKPTLFCNRINAS